MPEVSVAIWLDARSCLVIGGKMGDTQGGYPGHRKVNPCVGGTNQWPMLNARLSSALFVTG